MRKKLLLTVLLSGSLFLANADNCQAVFSWPMLTISRLSLNL